MKTFFLEQSLNTNWVKNTFSKVKKSGNKIIINADLKKAKFKKKIKIAKQIRDILTKEKSRQIIVEKNLKQDKQFLNLLYSYNINICNPKWLFKQLTKEIVYEIIKEKNIQESEIWICINELDETSKNNIIEFAKKFKRLNIITNHIGRFKEIEDKLYKLYGILINISNNKRKSLVKANIILNIDFPKEILNQFAIYDEAIIIDFEGNSKIRKKRFNGKIINEYEFIIDTKSNISNYIKANGLTNYDERDICQALEVVPDGKIGGIIW